MPRKKDTPESSPSRYMTFEEIAADLGIHPRTVRDKVLVTRELPGVDVGNGTGRATWRVPRAAYELWCQRIEDDSAQRFGRTA